MTITEQDVTRIARLARLQLDKTSLAHAQQDLQGILSLIEQLQAVNTQGVEPLTHPLAALQTVELRLREDLVTEPSSPEQRSALMQNAPQQQEGLFLVPRVIE